ncbi:MAG: hypothetical protein DMF79_19085 [Acidobacteria bacterium]|nr:MAG: hypothetical protein DMF79_19085 [Acidobacteriota bacterium]
MSVQVDFAWGNFDRSGFHGVATDFADFPFIQELGLSSYGYLAGYAEPEELPLDYYTRLLGGRTLPLMVVEGGWTSTSLGGIASSPDEQRRYILRQLQILDAAQAIAVFQLTFTDLDLAAISPPEELSVNRERHPPAQLRTVAGQAVALAARGESSGRRP